jgi:hypothetical protein
MNYSSILMDIVAKSTKRFLEISDELWIQHKTATSWSKKEILGHLIDSAYNNHQRFLRAASQDNLIFVGYDQVDWVKKHACQSRNTKDIILHWKLCNEHLANLIYNLPSQVINRQTTDHNFDQIGFVKVPAGKSTSLGCLIWDYLYHLEHHIAQILPSYQRMLEKDSFIGDRGR